MNTWTVWHRPIRGRRWYKLAGAGTRDEAWRLMLADPRSGGWLVVPPGSPPPTPTGNQPTKPAGHQGGIRWD